MTNPISIKVTMPRFEHLYRKPYAYHYSGCISDTPPLGFSRLCNCGRYLMIKAESISKMKIYEQPSECVFCRKEIDFSTYEKFTLIKIERDDDGASVETKFWSHEDCLPEGLKGAIKING